MYIYIYMYMNNTLPYNIRFSIYFVFHFRYIHLFGLYHRLKHDLPFERMKNLLPASLTLLSKRY